MAEGSLRAVVATSTLDLGIDWGDVDLVIHVGAPKGASRFIQRIGRSNHRLDEPSQAILVPSNRFEVLECRAAVDAAEAGEQDVTFSRQGALDVLAQHILGTACAGDFDPAELYAEVDLGRALRAAEARDFRPRARLRHRRRLRAEELRALRQAEDDAGRQTAHRASALRPGLSHERRHHRRRTHDQGAPRRAPRGRDAQGDDRRPHDGRGRRVLHRAAAPGRCVRARRRGAALRRHGRERSVRHPRLRARPRHPELQQRQVPAVDASGGARARHAGRRRTTGAGCRRRSPIGWSCSRSARSFPGATRC